MFAKCLTNTNVLYAYKEKVTNLEELFFLVGDWYSAAKK